MRSLSSSLFALVAVLVACSAGSPAERGTGEPSGGGDLPERPTTTTPSGRVVPAPRVPTSIVMHHADLARTGANLTENVLSPKTVSPSTFGLLYTRDVVGQVYAQPLYVPGLAMGAAGTRDVLFVATEHNDVYAFDAMDASARDPLWHVSLGPAIPSKDFDENGVMWRDITVEVGVTSTPAIDLASNVIYVVAKTKESDAQFYRIHALDLATGAERAGSPVVVAATADGTGLGSVSGKIPFVAFFQLQRPAITLANGVLYIAFGSHGDFRDYHGWLLAYDAATLALLGTHVTTPSSGYAAIWQAGQGPTVDDRGDVYFLTGNGPFDGSKSPPDLGDAIVKVRLDRGPSPGLSLVDWFVPFNHDDLEADDLDLGSAGALLLSAGGARRIVGGGKEGKLYVLDPDAMGHSGRDDDSQIVQTLAATSGIIHGAPVWFGGRIYVGGQRDAIHAYRFHDGVFDADAFSTSAPVNDAILAISADDATGGIVWSMEPSLDNDDGNIVVPGKLRAYDAEDLTHVLYDSDGEPPDALGIFAKFCPPAIADGKVFAASHSGRIGVYGLK